MTFSIVVPVYNAEKYIDECLETIISQTDAMEKGASIEILLIENGSNDRSGSICDRYASQYDEVKALHFGKIGAYNARREGMKAATGDYIVFVDSDDLLAKDSIDKLFYYISELGKKSELPDVVLYNAADSQNRQHKMFDFPFDEGRLYKGRELMPFYEVMCSNDSLNALWNKCISKKLADKCLGDESRNEKVFNHGEDLLQTAQFLDNLESIAYLDSILYYYRENREGLTGGYHKEFMDNQVEAWKAFDEYAFKWTGDRFKSIIDERKTLTCMICLEKLIYSNASIGIMKKELKRMLESDFFREYGYGRLPNWTPESSLYIKELLKASDPYKKLCKEGTKFAFKRAVKRLLSR